ncbi:SigE family RNA polymerase sigma factor [Blastococcus sp. TBT05-19]|uniref:SigE family RNA polymerase sigma factor n=1 Tax=Blastococcus sp. TBT05-19 TaxID=2250581 RepID=UPI000DEA162E|nr:SigE family RNA polymerase sigma factor [Blastococcus sp. TBT05-19]RBY91820.1 SigE family RNA polymerase sigma factor [Blastococcus sp. TBT05-19]
MRDDDEASFEAFVAARSAALLRTAVLLTHDRGYAEDLLQAALIKVYRHWRRVSERGDPYAYVRKALVTTAAGWHRRRTVQEIVDLPAVEQADDRPRSDLGDRDELTQALATLPPRMRAVLVLRYWEDLSETGTAAVLGCSVNTVKTQTSRGLDRLRALVENPAYVNGGR